MHVVGTAGHVDHGKSALVQALTGMDPDRLREEKERGLTIDLGFAWLTLPSGRDVSIVDVPGHERFIKNMLAGAGGIDLALLVIDAEEGPMPQTREHLAILDLLEVPHGIVVLTKVDLVDEEYVDLVEAELDEALAGSLMANAPRVRTSARSGAGLAQLVATLDDVLAAAPAKRDLGRPRLPVDRVFSVAGFGTVVTGTLVDGSLEAGQEVELRPGGARARVRSLQRHQEKATRLAPGTRAAVNLSGVQAGQVERGMVVTVPGWLRDVLAVDVRLSVPKVAGHALSHNAGVTFLTATAETEARVRLLESEQLEPGESSWAQVVFDRQLAIAPGDRYVVRTSNETVGGGRVVALNPRRHRRNDTAVLERLQRNLAGSLDDRILDHLAQGPGTRESLATALSAPTEEVEQVLASLAAAGPLVRDGQRLASRAWLTRCSETITRLLGDYHGSYPLRRGAPREHLRTSAGLTTGDFELVLRDLVEAGALTALPDGELALPDHTPRLDEATAARVELLLRDLEAGGASPPNVELDAEVVRFLAAEGRVVDLGGSVIFARGAYDAAREAIITTLNERGSMTLAEARDLLGTTRKYSQALLEHLDAEKVTRRTGETRVLRSREVRS